jgi:hypothetical protein
MQRPRRKSRRKVCSSGHNDDCCWTCRMPLSTPGMKSSSGWKSTMINVGTIRQVNYDGMDSPFGVLVLDDDRIYWWLILDSPEVVREDLDAAIEYVMALQADLRIRASGSH